MQRSCRLTYIGRDRGVPAELAERFAFGRRFAVESLDPEECGDLSREADGSMPAETPLELWPSHDWYRVVFLDLDVAAQAGLRLLKRLRAAHAGIPLIVIASRSGLQLAQQDLAWLRGTDALLFKPLSAAAMLEEVVGDAVRRLDCWQETLAQLELRAHTPLLEPVL